jgi:hypothetical protein
MLDICDGIHNILTIQWRTHGCQPDIRHATEIC